MKLKSVLGRKSFTVMNRLFHLHVENVFSLLQGSPGDARPLVPEQPVRPVQPVQPVQPAQPVPAPVVVAPTTPEVQPTLDLLTSPPWNLRAVKIGRFDSC